MRRVAVAGVLVMVATALASSPAEAAVAVWALQPTPNPSGIRPSSLSGVACPSTTVCTTVGSYVVGFGADAALAEGWNGSSWARQPTRQSGAQHDVLSSVACPSTTVCTAVGYYVNASGVDVTLAERWNGSSWSLQSTPNPSGAQRSSLSGVACPSTTVCTAVGYYLNASGVEVTLAERWNGSSWSLKSTPNPSGAQRSFLSGVACPSTTMCTAIGDYYNASAVYGSLAERWDGSSWSLTPNPSGALSSVACPSTTVCTAVGNDGNLTLAERWNGSSWTLQSTPNPSGAQGSSLSGVACPSTTVCTAVGNYLNASGVEATLAERWNGSSWSLQSTPNPSGAQGSFLSGAACPSTTVCTAVGQYINASGVYVTLAERWNGSGWATQSTPNPSGAQESSLSSVTCPSTKVCIAVGNYFNASGVEVTLAERWNGSGWALQPTPNPSGALQSYLSGVACPSTTVCIAVGEYTNSSGVEMTLAERWNGSSWVIQATPNPSGSQGSVMSGVACPSTTVCIAVGNYFNASTAEYTLAERWNGSGWATQSTPNPSGSQGSVMSGVACPSTTVCIAVGNYFNASGVEVTLAERWNGSGWATQSTPNPSGALQSDLSGVACPSTTACTGVGNYLKASGVEVTLAERWNGSGWATQSTPNPSGATFNSLSGVACPSTTPCIAVGGYTNSSGVEVTLAERWNGSSWAVQSTPNPSGATSNSLSGVACPSITPCIAVGAYVKSSGPDVTLAEGYS